jgi:hypothetical protein
MGFRAIETRNHANGVLMTQSLSDIVPVLQGAIGPVILISGIGLLLLSLTNRLARIFDRARFLAAELRGSPSHRQPHLHRLVRLLRRRAVWNRWSISFAALSILLVAFLIILLFVQALLGLDSALPVILVFSLCLLSLVVSEVAFIWDIHLSAVTMNVELDDVPADRVE